MRLRATVLLCMVLFGPGCGSDPRSIRITTDDPQALLARLASVKGLSVEETALLHRRLARLRMESADSPAPLTMAGRTVGQLIAEQRTWEVANMAALAEGQEYAANFRARTAAQTRTMNEALVVRVLETIEPWNPEDVKPSTRRVSARMTFLNLGSRDITEVEGALRFSDVYGRDIFEGSLTLRQTLAPGDTVPWMQDVDCTPFLDDPGPMRGIRLQDTKVVWEPRVIRYSDGTSLAVTGE